MKTIQYHIDTKQYFKKFLKPNKFSDNENLLKYYDLYEDNIKLFIEKELNWHIIIYYARISNSAYDTKEWFYVVDNGLNMFSSDDFEIKKLISYEQALNNAIQHLFKNIYSINI